MSDISGGWIADTTVLSNFAQAQRPELIALALDSRVAVTPEVLAELRRGEEAGRVPACDWSSLVRIEPTEAERQQARTWGTVLGPGEAEALAVARSRDYVLLTDDLPARRLASSLGVSLGGTAGVLSKLVETAHLSRDQAESLYSLMLRLGYRGPGDTLAEIYGWDQ
jgi:predicted nucleic acid-binding protein